MDANVRMLYVLSCPSTQPVLGALTGLGAVASYGAISNVTYGGGLAVAWIAFFR